MSGEIKVVGSNNVTDKSLLISISEDQYISIKEQDGKWIYVDGVGIDSDVPVLIQDTKEFTFCKKSNNLPEGCTLDIIGDMKGIDEIDSMISGQTKPIPSPNPSDEKTEKDRPKKKEPLFGKSLKHWIVFLVLLGIGVTAFGYWYGNRELTKQLEYSESRRVLLPAHVYIPYTEKPSGFLCFYRIKQVDGSYGTRISKNKYDPLVDLGGTESYFFRIPGTDQGIVLYDGRSYYVEAPDNGSGYIVQLEKVN